MNSGATADRVYDGLKRRLLSGQVPPGRKLEPAALAGDLMSSVTPVRDALHRLIGERLVETRSGEGFYAPLVTEPGLSDLYAWHGEVVSLALQNRDRAFPAAALRHTSVADDPALEAYDLFERIGSSSGNAEHRRTIEAVGDRLQIARVAEPGVFADLAEELDAIRRAVDRDDAGELKRRVAAYHRRRRRSAALIVRAIYRDA